MSLYDFFRRAFGPTVQNPAQPGFRNPIWEEESDDDEDELDDEFRYAPNSPFGFRMFSGDIMDMQKYFEQQMDEMLKNFHSSLFGSDLLQLPDSSFQESSEQQPPHRETGPNKYLKPWYDQNVIESDVKKDTDVDGRVTVGDLRKLFPSDEEESPATVQVPKKIFGQSVITRIVRTSDGRLEEEKRVRRNDGQEEVSLIRQIGDQKYKVVTKTDSQTGATDTTEEFINLDQDKLDEFNKKWSENKKSKSSNYDTNSKVIPISPTDNRGNITRLFEKWFK